MDLFNKLENYELYSEQELLNAIYECSDINWQNRYGQTALSSAVCHCNETIIQAIIDMGANVNFCSDSMYSALFLALIHNKPISIIKILINGGANVNEINGSENILMLTVRRYPDPLPVTQLLLDSGADINIQNNVGETALMVALQRHPHPSIDLLTVLINASVQDNALFYTQDIAIIKMLVNAGANLNKINKYGDNILANNWEVADSKIGYIPITIAEQLIEMGININNQDNSGNTFLMRLCQNKKNLTTPERKEYITFLINNGANVNLQNRNGNTAMHIAAENRDLNLLQFLLTFDFDTTIRNKGGQTVDDIINYDIGCWLEISRKLK